MGERDAFTPAEWRVSTIANLLKQKLDMSLPIVIRREPRQIFESSGIQAAAMLFLHIKFEIRARKIGGYVALMMDLPSIEELRVLISEYVASVARGAH